MCPYFKDKNVFYINKICLVLLSIENEKNRSVIFKKERKEEFIQIMV